MIIKNAKFETSVADPSKFSSTRSEIAFVGRSNVGKSSLLNMLCGNSKLARTSSTPGRTRLINYFLINNDFYFVDLPGYGYAKATKSIIEGWQGLLEPYLIGNPNLKLVCVLVDSRITPTDQDKQMINYLAYYNIPFVVVATKVDKYAKSKISPALIKIANELGLGKANVIGVSSENKYGKDILLNTMQGFLNN